MTTYAHVTDGTVDRVGLPTTGTLSDGRTVSGYDRLPLQTLTAEGWLPLIDGPPAYDATTEQAIPDGYDVLADRVIVRYRVEPIPTPQPEPPTPEQQRIADLETQVAELTDYVLMMGV